MTVQDSPSNGEKIKTSKRDDLNNSLELFGEDEKTFDVDAETQYEIKISKELTNNLLKTSRLVSISTLTLQGYEEVPSKKEAVIVYRLVKNPIASSEIIKAFQGILKTYADESNIVGKTDWEDFSIQAMSDWRAFYKVCLKEKATPTKFIRVVYRIFQDCIIAIGKIVCDNPNNMGNLFTKVNQEVRADDYRSEFK